MERIFPGDNQFTLYLNSSLHHKASILAMVMKYNDNNKSRTISRLYDVALYEYFQNHKDEIIKQLDSYYSEGCGQKFMEEIGL